MFRERINQQRMKQINWGFIGCGEVTEKKSGPAFNEVEGSQVVAVMSRSENKARSYAERHHVRKWYTDASELIEDPDVNAVYIATPPSSHATFAIMAMRAGKPCYIEKPLAASYNDCIRINRISEQTGVPCFVAYYRRYLPYFQKVKEIIESGTIGNVVNVQVRFSVPPRDLDFQSGKEMQGLVKRCKKIDLIFIKLCQDFYIAYFLVRFLRLTLGKNTHSDANPRGPGTPFSPDGIDLTLEKGGVKVHHRHTF